MRTSKLQIMIAIPWIVFLILHSMKEINDSLFASTILGLSLLLITLVMVRLTKLDSAAIVKKSSTTPTVKKESINWVAHYDSLTNLPNRIFFIETLNKAISHAKRHQKILAVLHISVDKFDVILDHFGSDAADEVLKEIAVRFASSLRGEDVLSRLDKDEFIVLLTDVNKPKFASAVADKILQTFAKPFKVNNEPIYLSPSIGICIFPNDAPTLEMLLSNAETTLSKAKNAGGKCYQFYTPEMEIEAREYIQLKTDLANAISNEELVLYFQPKMHIKNGDISGVEALIRWNHPKLGLIHPARFIPIAEEAGLINVLGEWILHEACRINKHWQDEGFKHMTIAVNLSEKQFNDSKFPELITKVLTETGLSASDLELEVTEKIVMTHLEKAKQTLETLKATGVQISLDHFGTGYTAIAHLKQFPISIVKIDQTFIEGIPNNPDDNAITNGLIALSHNLSLQVVAEGVETAEQVEYLTAQGCDMVQGYYLSHPVPAQKIELQFTKLKEEVLL